MTDQPDRIFELIASEFAGQTLPVEKAEIKAWRAESVSNERLYQSARVAWQEMDPGQAPDDFDEHVGWLALQQRLSDAGDPGVVTSVPFGHRGKPAKPFRRMALSLAALVVLGFLGLYLGKWGPFSDGLTWQRTKPGQQMKIELADGSLVFLQGNSEVGWEKGFPEDRLLRFKGQAFFEVASQVRPFVVQTEEAEIQVLGTKFDVWSRLTKTRVMVTEGKVKVSVGEAQSVTLGANQVVEVMDNNLGSLMAGEGEDRPAWLRQRLQFRNQPLAEVVVNLESWFGEKITFADPSLAELRVTGSFQSPTLETVLSEIAIALNLNYDHEKSGFILRR